MRERGEEEGRGRRGGDGRQLGWLIAWFSNQMSAGGGQQTKGASFFSVPIFAKTDDIFFLFFFFDQAK